MANCIGIGLLGLGNVGMGVYDILSGCAGPVDAGDPGLEIRRVAVTDMRKQRRTPVPESLLTEDLLSVVTDPSIHVVVELMGCPRGDTRPALGAIRDALRLGKQVVTANKKVLAEHGKEIALLAKEHGGAVRFEAAVCGAIPVIKILSESLIASRITALYGILNGTTNYILSRMSSSGSSMAAALREAQRLGYAEADATSDLTGLDAAYKLALLATLASGQWIDVSSIAVTGIESVTLRDVSYTAQLGYAVRLLACCEMRESTGIAALRVEPTLVPNSQHFGAVTGPTNAVLVRTVLAGDHLLMGEGAGGMATATAVVADILGAAQHVCGRHSRGGHTRFLDCSLSSKSGVDITAKSNDEGRYYLRVRPKDITPKRAIQLLAQNGVRFSQRLGNELRGQISPAAEVVGIVEDESASNLWAALQPLGATRQSGRATILRVFDLRQKTGLSGQIVATAKDLG